MDYKQFIAAIPVQGEIIKWIEYKKIASAQYGDITTGLNIENGKIFAIKRLELFKSEKSYNQELITSLKAEIEVLK